MSISGIRRSIAAAAFALAILGAAPSPAEPAAGEGGASELPRVAVRASIDERGEIVEGWAELEIANDTGRPIGRVPLWLYPNRFREPGPGLDERTVKWLYPAGRSRGSMDLSEASWNGAAVPEDGVEPAAMPEPGIPAGAEGAIAWVSLPEELAPGDRGSLRVRFRVRVPLRRGRFGRWSGAAMLAGGWFPRPLADLTSERPDLPLGEISADVRVDLPPGRGAVLGDRIFPVSEEARCVEVEGYRGRAISLVVMERMEVFERELPWGTLVYVDRDVARHEPTWEDTRTDDVLSDGLPQLAEVNVPRRALDVAEATARLLLAEAPGLALPERLVMVEVPVWDHLAQRGPGHVLVSNRIWEMTPRKGMLAFHDLALARAVAAELSWSAAGSSRLSEHPYVNADVVGTLISGLYASEVNGEAVALDELIGPVSFVPALDDLLYAPQIPFRDVYTGSVEEPDPLRDEPWRFMNRLPRGRRILAKLEDLAGADGARRVARSMMSGEAGFEEEARGLLGDRADLLFGQWYGDYPRMNYRLGEVADEPLGDGRWRHRVEVVRDGDQVVEPVDVRIADESGESSVLRWEGEGERGEVEWISGAPLEEVEVDPDHRLLEAPDLIDDHPLADNLDTLPWRLPLITHLGFGWEFMSGDIELDAGLALRQRYDISNVITLGGGYSPRRYGGYLGYLRYFGGKRTLNERVWYFGPSVGIYQYDEVEDPEPGLPSETLFGALMGAIQFSIGRDDRRYFQDPRSGSAFSLNTTYFPGKADDGRIVHAGKISLRGFGLWSPGFGHTFALYGGGFAVIGEPVAANLATLSDRQILRAFEVNETYHRLGLYLVLEYRHTLFDLSRVSVLEVGWFDRLQGVLFAGVGTVSWPDGYDGMFSAERVFSEVGYGLRFHLLTLGSLQHMIAIDLAIPLTPADRTVEYVLDDGSEAHRERDPVRIMLGFSQTH